MVRRYGSSHSARCLSRSHSAHEDKFRPILYPGVNVSFKVSLNPKDRLSDEEGSNNFLDI